MSADLPKIVAAAMERARAAGFEFGCEVEVGRVLAVLAGAVPDGGRIGELGTGVGVGTAWLVHGLGVRTDVEVVTIESDAATAAVAGSVAWPEFVRLIEGDALEHLEPNGPYDLLFPDAPAGKLWGFERSVSALRPGGMLLLDDLDLADPTSPFARQLRSAREAALSHPQLVSARLDFGGGMVLSTRRG